MTAVPSDPNLSADVQPETIDAERRAVVERARQAWIRRLMDTSRRNNLLYFRDLKKGTLDLEGHDAKTMADLLAGELVSLSRLLPKADVVTSTAALREIGRRALGNREEKGLQTLFLAMGMASWTPSDEGRPPESAVLLIPLVLETQGTRGRTLSLKRGGPAQVNLTLLHALAEQHACQVTPEDLQSQAEGEDAGADPATVSARLEAKAQRVPGFTIRPRAVIGNFSFQKMAMVEDLQERGEELAANDIIAALAGDSKSRESIRGSRSPIDMQELDRTPPENEFLVMDADSSQQRVVTAVLQGQSGVIQGPPGGGKSQTIANLIASLAAAGQRVLFVAEKRAALEVVQRRLADVDLGHLALDLHGADISQRAVMQRIAQTLDEVRESAPVNAAQVHARFSDRRLRLNGHSRRMHLPRPPSGLSIFEIQGRLLRLPDTARTELRWRGEELNRLDAANAEAVRNLLTESSGLSSLLRRDDPSPWTGAHLTDGASVQQAVDLATRLSGRSWPAFSEALERLAAATGLRAPATMAEAASMIDLLTDVNSTLERYDARLFHEDLQALITELAPAAKGGGATLWAMVSDGAFREARTKLRSLRTAGPVSVALLLAEAQAACNQRERWAAWAAMPPQDGSVFPNQPRLASGGQPATSGGGPLFSPEASTEARDVPALSQPVLSSDLDAAVLSMKTAFAEIDPLARVLPAHNLRQIPLAEMPSRLAALAADTATPYRIPRLVELEQQIERRGAAALLEEIRRQQAASERWIPLLEYAWLSSCLDHARLADANIAAFNGPIHDSFVEDFRETDRERLRLASARVRRAHGERVIAVMNEYKEQADLVQREANKRSRHLPLRKLLAQAPDVLTVLCPCWMTSPLSVSQLLDADQRYFDIVLFDEASQVLPEDAIPALLRGTLVVVAGDQHQLPPTTFFADGGSDDGGDDEADPTGGFESLLDLMAGFLEPWPLDWHYRSRDESLIAFSNRHIYGDRLITFPGCGRSPCITHELVEQPVGQDGQEESAPLEVRRVVELVLTHAAERPDETLGVIAMGIPHARRIEAALDEALKSRPELDDFFNPSRHERFFIKNLERVQGDERDAILLTVGYGKDRAGNLPYRFGPLLTQGGERRLNVAITRARSRMTLVSSFSHHDMDPGRSKARGVQLLRLYLEYAASQGRILGDSGQSNVPMNFFEADVCDALTSKGVHVLSQWGASKFRIDLVAQHPEKPGRLVLAIECDGASYHSAPTARDRDRLRQQQLEALGWRFHRIWSTDWFLRREEEIARAIAAYEAAVEFADLEDAKEGSRMAAPPPSEIGESSPASPAGPAVRVRATLPSFPRHTDIDDYPLPTLMSLVKWVQSDGLLRTDDEIIREMLPLLGYSRRGPRIVAVIQNAIERTRDRRQMK